MIAVAPGIEVEMDGSVVDEAPVVVRSPFSMGYVGHATWKPLRNFLLNRADLPFERILALGRHLGIAEGALWAEGINLGIPKNRRYRFVSNFVTAVMADAKPPVGADGKRPKYDKFATLKKLKAAIA